MRCKTNKDMQSFDCITSSTSFKKVLIFVQLRLTNKIKHAQLYSLNGSYTGIKQNVKRHVAF